MQDKPHITDEARAILSGKYDSMLENNGWFDEFGQYHRPKADCQITTKQPLKPGALSMEELMDIQVEPMEWPWRYKIPRSKLTLLVGDPGLGKSLLTTYLASMVTRGGDWPVSGTYSTPGDVIWLSAEDDAADTLRPRVEAAGGDLSRIHIVQGTVASYTK